MIPRSAQRLLLSLFLLASFVACSPLVKDGPPALSKTALALEAGLTVGQTLVARDSGLEGVQVFLSPGASGDGDILLRLRSGSQSESDLAVAQVPVQSITTPGWYRFSFPPQSDSQNHDYYVVLEQDGKGRVNVGTAPGDAYLDGALYQNGEPRDAQLSFRLAYEPWQMSIGLLKQVLNWLGVLGLAFFLFVVPGWALFTFWSPSKTLSWAERLGLAVGLSLAVYPLLLLWTNLVHLNLGALYAWLPGLTGLAILVWRYRPRKWSGISSISREWMRSAAWEDLALVLVFGAVVLVRFWVVRSLDVPLWGDSYQHTVIAQLLADHGGLFNSWEPYSESQTFTYHFGFHTAAVVFHWISGLDMPRAVLWTGQVLNALAVFALYPLAVRIGGNRWAGVAAVLVGGLLSPVPMEYINWGRYTQLAGQTVLPAAICLSWMALETRDRDWRLIALAWIALAGLGVTHYRVLIFAALFFVAFFCVNLAKVRSVLPRTLVLAIGGGLLFLPWFIHTFAGKIMLIVGAQLSTPVSTASSWTQEYNAVGDVFSYLPIYLWLLLPVSIMWGLWRREKAVAIFTFWWLLVLVAANPQWLRLPGQGALTNFAVFIAAYIPASAMVGAAAGWLVAGWRRNGVRVALLVAICALGLWGARSRLPDITLGQSVLATEPDERAAAWIRQNVPANALFLVNAFSAYGDSSVVGSDGGWWLPLLAGRRTMLPPLNYASEQGPRPDYREWINALPHAIQVKGITSPEVTALLRDRGITHVYIGQRQGRVNAPGPAMLPVEPMLASPAFRPIYHQDRVWVFEVVP